MKTHNLIIILSGLIFIFFASNVYAVCVEPDWSVRQSCYDACWKLPEGRVKCGNECDTEYFKLWDAYKACQKQEEAAIEAEWKRAEEQRKIEEQKELEEQKIVPRIISSVKSYLGTVDFIRDGEISEVTSGLEFSAGDIIGTGGDGRVELAFEDGVVQLSENTVVGLIGFKFDPPRVVSSDVPELDYQYQPDEMAFWKNLFESLVEFHYDNPPKYLKTCLTAMSGITAAKCLADTATYVYEGITWFDKKIKEDYSRGTVVTPVAAITTDGTEFIVEVAPDGSTTVTTLDGTVFVTDLASMKTVRVDVNNKITIPKTSTGLGEEELQQGLTLIDQEVIDKWWLEDREHLKPEKGMIFYLSLIAAVVLIVSGVVLYVRGRKLVKGVKEQKLTMDEYQKKIQALIKKIQIIALIIAAIIVAAVIFSSLTK